MCRHLLRLGADEPIAERVVILHIPDSLHAPVTSARAAAYDETLSGGMQHLQGVQLTLQVLLLSRSVRAGALQRGKVGAGRLRDAVQLPMLF